MATLGLPYKTMHDRVRLDNCQLTVFQICNTRLCKLMRCQAVAATSDMMQCVYMSEGLCILTQQVSYKLMHTASNDYKEMVTCM